MTHFHFSTGTPCSCPWGRRDLLSFSKVAASWEEMKGWKKLQSPEAQKLTYHLEGQGYVNDRTEKWMPWLFGQARQGNLEFNSESRYPHNWLQYSNPYDMAGVMPEEVQRLRLTPDTWRHWGDWFNSGHPTRQAIDPNKASIQDVHRAVDTWGEDMEARKKVQDAHSRKNDGEVVHSLPDQWTIRKLQTADEAKREGEAMGHCVGSYGNEIENGDTLAYSLRDPKGHPHVTLGIDPQNHENSLDPVTGQPNGPWKPIPNGGTAYNICGTGNSDPKPEYRERIKNWMDTFPDEDRPHGEGEDSDEFGGLITHPDEVSELGDPRENERGLDSYGMKASDIPFDYKRILDNMVGEHNYQGDPDLLYQHALSRGEIPELAKATEKFGEESQENFQQWMDMNYDMGAPMYPDEEPEEGDDRSWDEREEAYYEELREWENEHPGLNLTGEMYNLINPHYHSGGGFVNPEGGYLNEIAPTKVGKTAASGPLYYRWVFTPSGVELAHNQDEHPSNLQFHQDLGSEVNEQSMVHGYAYRIRNGWRLTDWEHRPLTDPYVIKNVVDAIRNEEGVRTASEVEPTWEPEWDYDRLHYGKPLPRVL